MCEHWIYKFHNHFYQFLSIFKLINKMYFLFAVVTAQESFKCPDDFGFYPHDISCDKYWKCDNNVAELKTCGNGLAFDATDNKFLTENCDYLHNVECGDRTQLGKFFLYSISNFVLSVIFLI